MRASLFDVLSESYHPVSARSIAKTLSEREGRVVRDNSVYRILEPFMAANIAHRVESANGFVANPHPHHVRDCILLICDNCGRVSHLYDVRTAELIRAAAKSTGFLAKRLIIELPGRCDLCAV